METTILYLGHENIDKRVQKVCYDKLLEAADVLPIVEMHQDPTWELSGLSMYKQMLAGLEQVKTKFVAIAEHDCIYSKEHFRFIPPDDRYWYNLNCWLLQYNNPNYPEQDGVFSFWPNRRVQSQLICNAEKLREITEVQISIVSDERWDKIRGKRPIGEPGTVGEKAMRITSFPGYKDLHAKVKNILIGLRAADFTTEIPNIDIRWGGNFTGPRRGGRRTKNLSPWGSMLDIMVE